MADKFYLGGDNFYGFRERGIQSNEKGEGGAGGDTFFLAGLHLCVPFPKYFNFPDWIRPELFVQAGNLVNSQKSGHSSLFKKDLIRSSFGFGFAMKTGWGRLSLNLASPLSQNKNDITAKHVQFNVQMSWL